MNTAPSGDPPPESGDLVARARTGDEEAWRAIFERHRAMLLLSIQARMNLSLRKLIEAEDVLQSAFLVALEHISSFEYRGEGSLRKWLKRIVVNETIDVLRRTGQEEAIRSIDTDSGEDPVPPIYDGGPRPSESFSQAEQQRRMLECLAGLHEDDQELIVMRIFEEKEMAEIAAIAGCSASTASRRYRAAVERMLRALET